MNDQRSLSDQIRSLYVLANKNGLYDAADWVQSISSRQFPSSSREHVRYYRHPTLGVQTVVPAHENEEYTFIPAGGANRCWIRTADLHTTRELAEKAPIAEFLADFA